MASRPGLQRSGSSIAAANKTIVLVTGANTGIGFEIVKSLSALRNDFQILLGCRDVHKGEVAVSSLGAPSNINPIQLDISSDESIDQAAKAIEQHFGRLDILINNAGTAGVDLQRNGGKPTSRQTWQHIFDVNVVGTGVLTDRLAPLLQASKAPKIIFITSTLGSFGTTASAGKVLAPGFEPYSASKSAVNMMALNYAYQYPDFKVNACCPGHRGTGLNDLGTEGEMDPALGAVNAVRLATEVDGPTGTYSRTEGAIPW